MSQHRLNGLAAICISLRDLFWTRLMLRQLLTTSYLLCCKIATRDLCCHDLLIRLELMSMFHGST